MTQYRVYRCTINGEVSADSIYPSFTKAVLHAKELHLATGLEIRLDEDIESGMVEELILISAMDSSDPQGDTYGANS